MFPIDCPGHGRRILVPPSRIRHLRNTATGIRLELECWCGTLVTVRTGRLERQPTAGTGRSRRAAGHGSNL